MHDIFSHGIMVCTLIVLTLFMESSASRISCNVEHTTEMASKHTACSSSRSMHVHAAYTSAFSFEKLAQQVDFRFL